MGENAHPGAPSGACRVRRFRGGPLTAAPGRPRGGRTRRGAHARRHRRRLRDLRRRDGRAGRVRRRPPLAAAFSPDCHAMVAGAIGSHAKRA